MLVSTTVDYWAGQRMEDVIAQMGAGVMRWRSPTVRNRYWPSGDVQFMSLVGSLTAHCSQRPSPWYSALA